MTNLNQWWIPNSVIDTKSVRAHLLPASADGRRSAALCGEGRISWAKTTPDAPHTFCHACQCIGGVRRVSGRDAVTESRAAALVAADWCLRQDLGADELRDLLDALMEDPYEARRAA